MSHWRTTAIGILMILGSTASFVGACLEAGGIPKSEDFTILGVGLAAGTGFLRTADAKTTDKKIDEASK